MSRVFLISDTHFGHSNIARRRHFHDDFYHDNTIISNWNKVVHKHDTVIHLGDVTMESRNLEVIKQLNGTKKLILGNHDKASIDEYSKYFSKVYGMLKYKGFWLTHCPMHPNELYNKKNIHGHVHEKSLDDKRYINVSCDVIDFTPISFEDIVKRYGH